MLVSRTCLHTVVVQYIGINVQGYIGSSRSDVLLWCIFGFHFYGPSQVKNLGHDTYCRENNRYIFLWKNMK